MGFDLGIDDEYQVGDDDLKKISQGHIVPAGQYKAQVTDIKEVQANTGTEGLDFEFTILDGDWAGKAVRDTLWLTEKTEDRKKLFMCRLGILIKQGEVYVRNKAVQTWLDTIGQECVIDVVVEEYEKKDKSKGQKNRLKYEGIYPANHLDGTPPASSPAASDKPSPKPSPKSPTKPAAKPTPSRKPATVPDDM